jgi:ribulose bisphosphate carboxylase small subunit
VPKKPPLTLSRQSQQFKILQDKWYTKLQKLGFNDIEQDEDRLKNWESSKFLKGKSHGKSAKEVAQANDDKQEYYRLAGHFLHDHKFENAIEKFVWEKHADGVSHTKIPALLKRKGIKKERHWVWEIISRLKKLMIGRYNNHE